MSWSTRSGQSEWSLIGVPLERVTLNGRLMRTSQNGIETLSDSLRGHDSPWPWLYRPDERSVAGVVCVSYEDLPPHALLRALDRTEHHRDAL